MIPHDIITSTANPRLREAVRLREAPARRDSGLTLVDGGREVRRALAAGIPLVDLFLDESILAHTDSITHDPDATGLPSGADLDSWLAEVVAGGTRITLLSKPAFEKLAFGSRNEGSVGVVRFCPGPLSDWTTLAERPVLIVERVEKPGNLGAILRTADAAGLAGVIVCDARTDPANPAVIRASLGAVFSVKLSSAGTAETIAWCSQAPRRDRRPPTGVDPLAPGAARRRHRDPSGQRGPRHLARLAGSSRGGEDRPRVGPSPDARRRRQPQCFGHRRRPRLRKSPAGSAR